MNNINHKISVHIICQIIRQVVPLDNDNLHCTSNLSGLFDLI